jgi:hypothetical protein
MAWDSSVGIATRYGLDCPGIESRWWRDFPHPSSRPWGTRCFQYFRMFSGSKEAGSWFWPSTPSSAHVKERVELYLYSPCGPSWRVEKPGSQSSVPAETAYFLLQSIHRPTSFCSRPLTFIQSSGYVWVERYLRSAVRLHIPVHN